jgi:predicted esterase
VSPEALVVYAAPVRGGHIRRARIQDNGDGGTTPLPDGVSLHFDVSDRYHGIDNILVFHGDADNVVPYTDAEEIIRHAGNPKRLIRLEQGDHPMSRPDHQALFAREALQWFADNLFR